MQSESIKEYVMSDKTTIELVGYYDDDTPEGEHDYYDLFLDNGECMNEGEPLYTRPTQSQVEKMYSEFMGVS